MAARPARPACPRPPPTWLVDLRPGLSGHCRLCHGDHGGSLWTASAPEDAVASSLSHDPAQWHRRAPPHDQLTLAALPTIGQECHHRPPRRRSPRVSPEIRGRPSEARRGLPAPTHLGDSTSGGITCRAVLPAGCPSGPARPGKARRRAPTLAGGRPAGHPASPSAWRRSRTGQPPARGARSLTTAHTTGGAPAMQALRPRGSRIPGFTGGRKRPNDGASPECGRFLGRCRNPTTFGIGIVGALETSSAVGVDARMWWCRRCRSGRRGARFVAVEGSGVAGGRQGGARSGRAVNSRSESGIRHSTSEDVLRELTQGDLQCEGRGRAGRMSRPRKPPSALVASALRPPEARPGSPDPTEMPREREFERPDFCHEVK